MGVTASPQHIPTSQHPGMVAARYIMAVLGERDRVWDVNSRAVEKSSHGQHWHAQVRAPVPQVEKESQPLKQG